MRRRFWHLTTVTLCMLVVVGCASQPATEPAPAIEAPTAQPEAQIIAPAAGGEGFLLADVGFSTPESALHDPVADVYYVSNINGAPDAADDNGFISRVSPEGEVLDLAWIDGASDDVTLHAPKGMALAEDALWVTDITALRAFSREMGAPLDEVPIEGAAFLNDVAIAPDGALWVTDSATGALYRVAPDRSVEQVATIAGVNGIAFFNETPWVVSAGRVLSVEPDGTTAERATAPAGQLDGLVILRNGALVVSSWSGSAVYAIGMNDVQELASSLSGPADIGFDESRFYVLVPVFSADALQAVPLP